MHKKYIRRGGRKFGPYYYTTIRDKNGKVCSYYLSRDPEEARIKEQELKARELKSRTQSRVQIPLRPIIALLLVVCALAAVFTGLNMTGLVISGEVLSYTQDLDVTAEQPQTLDWQLEEAPESFHVQSVKLSGSLIGNGSARVYIENPSGERYTVFDSESVRTSGLDITGYVIAEPPAEPELTETLPEEPELPEETSEEETPPPEEGQPPEEPEPPTEPETLPEEPVPAEDTAGPGPVIAEPKNATTPETPEENATAPEPPEENITIPENETNITLPEENVTLPENETNITL
ncbi:MAG: hypothetical protein ACE5FW_01070, partial [Candidatus Aenigmatarchaeota archaeon]